MIRVCGCAAVHRRNDDRIGYDAHRVAVEIVIGGLLVIGWITLRSWYFSEGKKIKRLLRGARSWPIAELPENTHGRIVGRTRSIGETLTSPLSGRACVYYLVTVTQGVGGERCRIITESESVAFMIEDDTGRAIIEPARSRITLDVDHKTSSGIRSC